MADIKIGLIGGTGLGETLGVEQGKRHDVQTPFGSPSDVIIETKWANLPLLILSRHGPGHLINPSAVPSRANIFALKSLGCTHIIASGAVGSLRDEFAPGELVVPDQLIDKTTGRAKTFYEHAAVHVEFAEPFDPVLRQILINIGRNQSVKVHDRGCYVCMEGPALSTRAESLMHRSWGGDLIGMTAMPEAKFAREAEIAYALVALVTDYDCWRIRSPEQKEPIKLLEEIRANLQSATQNAMRLIRATIERIAENSEAISHSPALRALELAIWSDKTRIPPEEISRLSPLWGKYFR